MKKITLLLFILIVTNIFSQNLNQEKYINLIQNNKLDELFTHLQKWEEQNENDVELCIAYFNYYLRIGQTSKTILGPLGDGGYGLYEKQFYDKKPTEVALLYLDKALKIAPNRLDVHFGKSNILARTNQYDKLKNAIITFLNYSKEINDNWYWSNNVSFKDQGWSVEEAMTSGVTDYLNIMLSDYENSKTYIQDVLNLYLQKYPNNVIGLNVAARYYDLKGDTTTKISLLEKAHEIDPLDYIIIGNLAYTYESIKDNTTAIKYYKLMLEIDNESSQQYGRNGLERLNK